MGDDGTQGAPPRDGKGKCREKGVKEEDEPEAAARSDPVPSSIKPSAINKTPSTSSSPATFIGSSSPGAMAVVVESLDLVARITTFLANESVGARSELGTVAVVCRTWKTVAVLDAYWSPIVKKLLLEARKPPEERLQGGGRGELVEYGRCLVERNVFVGQKWWSGLRLGIEVLDKMDGNRILFVDGPILVLPALEGGEARLQIQTGPTTRRELGSPFSAASRGFHSTQEYLAGAHAPDAASRICVRVSVTDSSKRRCALLFEEEKQVLIVHEGHWGQYHVRTRDALVVRVPSKSFHVRVAWVVQRCVGQGAAAASEQAHQGADGEYSNFGVHIEYPYVSLGSIDEESIQDPFLYLLA